MIGKNIIFISLTILFLGFFMYQPLPPGITEPWKTRTMDLIVQTAESVAYVTAKITGRPFVDVVHEMSMSSLHRVHQNYPDIEVDNVTFDGIPVRIYRPKGLIGLSPCVIYIHGGGWMLQNIDNYDNVLVQTTLQTNMIVVAVRYRYSNKHPFPIPFEDSLKATAYLLRSGERWGVDVNRVALAGDSAGGNLAAAVAQRLSQEDPSVMAPIKLQVLICPVLQALSFNTKSWEEYGDFYLKKSVMIFFWAAYLGLDLNSDTYNLMAKDEHVSSSIQKSIYGSYIKNIRGRGKLSDKYNEDLARKLDHLVVDPFVSPLMADDLSKVAPAYIVAMEFDILKDEAVAYAERLKKAGVKTHLWLYKGQTHIFPIPFIFDHSPTINLFSNVSEYIKTSLTGE